MSFLNQDIQAFTDVLASKASVPGGGGASALVGAVGTALGSMVGALTVGKKKYADVEAEIIELMKKADVVRNELLKQIDEDARVFEPLSKAYGLPKETEEQKAEKERVMEACLHEACSVPMQIMVKCCEAIELQKEFAAKGSSLAISDAGVGVLQGRPPGRQPQRVHQHQEHEGARLRRRAEQGSAGYAREICSHGRRDLRKRVRSSAPRGIRRYYG